MAPSVKRTALVNAIAYVIGVIVSFVQAPFLIHRLGDERYGVWTLIGTVTGYYGLLDVGVLVPRRRGPRRVGYRLDRTVAVSQHVRYRRSVSIGDASRACHCPRARGAHASAGRVGGDRQWRASRRHPDGHGRDRAPP